MLGESLAGYIEPYMEKQSHRELQRIVDRFANRERLEGMAIYDKTGALLAATSGLSDRLGQKPPLVLQAIAANRASGQFSRLGTASVHIYAYPLRQHDDAVGGLVIVHDASYINTQSTRIWKESFVRVLVQVLLDRADHAADCPLEHRWTDRKGGTVDEGATDRQGHDAIPGAGPGPATAACPPKCRPLPRAWWPRVRRRKPRLSCARLQKASGPLNVLPCMCAANLATAAWSWFPTANPTCTPEKGESLEVVVPPSGLVTALEPILCACDGKWVAHGSGDADHETVDANDHLRVPPDDPKYTLRRVWLTKEEEEGYYFGFSNEGLWPLCHIAHTRPIFRTPGLGFLSRRQSEVCRCGTGRDGGF